MPATPATKNDADKENQPKPDPPTLKCLMDEYREELPSRLETLSQMALRAKEGSTEALQGIIAEAHKIRGTARLFGFPDVADATAEIEDVLRKVAADYLGFQNSLAWIKVNKALLCAKEAIYQPALGTDRSDKSTEHASRQTIETVLIVDDDASIRCIAEISLAEVGKWQVILADSGKKALEVLATNKPDLILLDVMMPGMDGLALFGIIKTMNEYKDTPVIFITAKVQNDEVQGYRKLGAAGVIPKPFDPMQLPTQILSILGAYVRA
jgi:CheY-like chemotaxis protein/HPt (histidine-containing phosphotransfer) domain-containing protein